MTPGPHKLKSRKAQKMHLKSPLVFWRIHSQDSLQFSIFVLLSQKTCRERHESMTKATLGIVTEDSAILVANITCASKNFQKNNQNHARMYNQSTKKPLIQEEL